MDQEIARIMQTGTAWVKMVSSEGVRVPVDYAPVKQNSSSSEEKARIMQSGETWAETDVDQERARIMQTGTACVEMVTSGGNEEKIEVMQKEEEDSNDETEHVEKDDDKMMCRDGSVDEWTEKVMAKNEEGESRCTHSEVERSEGVETLERAIHEENSDDKAKRKATLADSKESRNTSAVKEESEPDECLTTDESETRFETKRSSARLLTAALKQFERV